MELEDLRKITKERRFVLEKWLYDNPHQDFHTSDFTDEEQQYLTLAKLMPYEEIKDEILSFDALKPCEKGITEFLNKLGKAYHVKHSEVLARVVAVRTLSMYIDQHHLNIFPVVQKYHKLVRDKIADAIMANGEEPVTRILTDEEYWLSLLKKDREELAEVEHSKTKAEMKMELADKYEVLLSMIAYQGFTIEEIKEAAEAKRNKKGGFSRKIFLEKVIVKKK